MTCDECGKFIQAYPCACGYGKSLTPIRPIMTTLYKSLPYGSTQDEFGRTLYTAIETIGGILGLDEQRALAINKQEGYKVQGLLRRRDRLQKQLAALLPKLTEAEMASLLLKYAWIVAA